MQINRKRDLSVLSRLSKASQRREEDGLNYIEEIRCMKASLTPFSKLNQIVASRYFSLISGQDRNFLVLSRNYLMRQLSRRAAVGFELLVIPKRSEGNRSSGSTASFPRAKRGGITGSENRR